MKQVIVYSLDYCPYCKRAKTLLRERNISFKEIDVSRNEEKYSEKLEKKYGIKDVTYPRIIIGNERIGGCSDLEHLIDTHKLNTLLNEE